MTMEEAGIKKGSRVRALPTTQYAESYGNPRDCDGTVIDVYENTCRVEWDNGSVDGGYYSGDVGLIPTIRDNYSII